MDCLQRQECRTNISVRHCAGMWNSRQCSNLHWCIPWWRRPCHLGCWWQKFYTAPRHHMRSIPTRSCVCLISIQGSHRVSSWCASRTHGSLGITCIDTHGPWCGCTGWSVTWCNCCSGFGKGTCLKSVWHSRRQSGRGLTFPKWCGGLIGLT